MKLSFTKMHGCGNSYLYFNCFSQSVNDPAALAQCLSDVHFGVGSDGIILICPSEVADAKMRMFNADGSEGKMCGNGIRCVGKFLYDYGLVDGRTEITVETLSGIKHLTLYPENGQVTRVRVDMGQAILTPAAIPCTLPQQAGAPLTVRGTTYAATAVGMGNPHCVLFQQDDVDGLDLKQIGPDFENHPAFPERVNTEFINVLGDHELKMRVWERGSGETWACGTGACAAAVAAVLNGHCPKDSDILVHLRGGDLTIRYTDAAVWMTGPAVTVFEGTVEA